MSIIKSNMTAPPPAAAGGGGGPTLSSISEMNSLRFDGSSFLSRTPANGNRKTLTLSCWLKGYGTWFTARLNSGGGYPFWYASFTTSGDYSLDINADQSMGRYSVASFRDYTAWYHVVHVVDITNSNAEERQRLYVNGQYIYGSNANFNPNQQPATTTDSAFNSSSIPNYIGAENNGIGSLYATFNGYLANIHFIDGQALDANAFGEPISGVWVPKAYSGAYGTNGFHLDFASSNMDWTNSKVLDASGNGNDWNLN